VLFEHHYSFNIALLTRYQQRISFVYIFYRSYGRSGKPTNSIGL